MIIVLSIFVASLLFCFYMFYRNNKVLEESLRVLNLISNLAKKDIANGKNWRWRYDEYEKISYDKIFCTFWKPVLSFYKDCKGLKETKYD